MMIKMLNWISVLSVTLKTANTSRIWHGKAFQSFGAAQVKDLSPSVDLDMKLGTKWKIVI